MRRSRLDLLVAYIGAVGGEALAHLRGVDQTQPVSATAGSADDSSASGSMVVSSRAADGVGRTRRADWGVAARDGGDLQQRPRAAGGGRLRVRPGQRR